MIWALLFAALFKLLSGGSPFLVPKMDKYVKQCVVDKERKEKVLDLLKASKKERKEYLKSGKVFNKELTALFNSRESTQQQFDELFEKVEQSRNEYQLKNQEAAAGVQSFITKEEWSQIKQLIKKDILKMEKALEKPSVKTAKSFDKLKKHIHTAIEDEQHKEQALLAINEFQSSINETFQELTNLVLDEDAPQFQYEASQEDLVEFQNEVDEGVKDLLQQKADLHFKLVAATTAEEWKKLYKKIKLPY